MILSSKPKVHAHGGVKCCWDNLTGLGSKLKVNASKIKGKTIWSKEPREMSNLLGQGYGLLISCTLVTVTGSTEEAVEARSRKAQADLFIQSKDPKTFGSSIESGS